MTISKKHLINIAKILGENTKSNNKLIIELTLYLKSQNPKFNKDKFIDAIDKSRELKKEDEVYYDHKFDLRAKQVIDEANSLDVGKRAEDIEQGLYDLDELNITKNATLVKKAIDEAHIEDLKKEIKVLQSKVKTYEQDINNKPLNDMPTNINGRPFKGRL